MEITGKDFLENVFDVLNEKGTISINKNDRFNEPFYLSMPKIIGRLFYRFFNTNDLIYSVKFAEKKFNDLDTIGVYYFFFYMANGYEPYNLAKIIYNSINIGTEYGWCGNPFYVCTGKKLNGNELTVSYLYCNSNAGLPMFHDEKTKKLVFDVNSNKFWDNLSFIYNTFKYPNCGHYPDGLFYKKDLIGSLEEAIGKNTKALKILKKIYKYEKIQKK